MATKRKTTTAIVAGVTAVALLLGGTFAWTSISQQAKNEAIVDINPGGRLHDDFNGTNKDVYVENFSSGATGVDIFARIRLDQYFEVGQEAGKNKDSQDERNVNVELGGVVYDEGTWVTYKPVDADGNPLATLANPVQANGNWQWTLGNNDTNKPYYMPTFNMNKDSLEADVNGTYEGTKEGDIVYYDDYVKYGSADEATADSTIVNQVSGEEEYDWDSDTVWENDENNLYDNGGVIYDDTKPIDDGDVYKTTATHTAEQIDYAATVYTMAEWIAQGSEPGPYWVYDTDGWAYWAQPIAPGETTGLLLDGINMSKVPDDNYYYGINVVGQFATASDWEMFFAPESEGGAGEGQITDNAVTLMELITQMKSTETKVDTITVTAADDATKVKAGGTLQFSASVMKDGAEVEDAYKGVTWSVTRANVNARAANDEDTWISETGLLTVSPNETSGTVLTVSATSKKESSVIGELTVTVYEVPKEFKDIAAITPGSTQTVLLDGIEWYVLAKQDGKALLWAKDVIMKADGSEYRTGFGSNNGWDTSTARTYLNGTFLNSLTTLKDHVVATEIKTATSHTRPCGYTPTTDSIFLLTEADIFETANGTATSTEDEYTLGVVGSIVPEALRTSSQENWLRSPHTNTTWAATLSSDGKADERYITGTICLRPAMWVNIGTTTSDTETQVDAIAVTASDDVTKVKAGGTLQFTATVTKDGAGVEDAYKGVIWSISDGSATTEAGSMTTEAGSTISETGELSVSENEAAGTELTIYATSNIDDTVVGELTVTVYKVIEGMEAIDAITPGSTATVNIDGMAWYVLKNRDGKALLWAADVLRNSDDTSYKTTFGTSNQWKDSAVRTYLNNDYFNSLNVLKEYAASTTIYTASTHDRGDTNTYISTTDNVFLLSEADIFGTANESAANIADAEYTLGKAGIIVIDEMRASKNTEDHTWLRSPHTNSDQATVMSSAGTISHNTTSDHTWCLRPAMWVNIGTTEEATLVIDGSADVFSGTDTTEPTE